MKRILTYFQWVLNFVKNIPTVEQAESMGLTHEGNIYGDGITFYGCRSLWLDNYGRRYGCDEVLKK